MTRLMPLTSQILWPVAASRTQTDPPKMVRSVPSTTWSDPLPRTSERAGEENVLPSSTVDHCSWHRLLYAFRVLVSEALGKNPPVPTTIPVAPPARKPPTAGVAYTTL